MRPAPQRIPFITDRVRSTREGNVFSLSTPRGEGYPSQVQPGGYLSQVQPGVPEPGPAGGWGGEGWGRGGGGGVGEEGWGRGVGGGGQGYPMGGVP